MKTRQFGGMVIFLCCLAASAFGYHRNGDHPSVPWGVGGALAGTLIVAVARVVRRK